MSEEFENIDSGVDNTPLPEAGGIAWTEMLTKAGQKVNVTARGKTLIQAIDELNAGVFHAHEKYGWVGVAQVSNRPQGRKASQSKAPVRSEPEEKPGETGQSVIAQYEISKQPDGTAKLELYEAGHKYPDFRVVGWNIASVLKLLENVSTSSGKPWAQAIDDMETGMVNWIVSWEYSEKLKKTGKPYKNVKVIVPNTP